MKYQIFDRFWGYFLKFIIFISCNFDSDEFVIMFELQCSYAFITRLVEVIFLILHLLQFFLFLISLLKFNKLYFSDCQNVIQWQCSTSNWTQWIDISWSRIEFDLTKKYIISFEIKFFTIRTVLSLVIKLYFGVNLKDLIFKGIRFTSKNFIRYLNSFLIFFNWIIFRHHSRMLKLNVFW